MTAIRTSAAERSRRRSQLRDAILAEVLPALNTERGCHCGECSRLRSLRAECLADRILARYDRIEADHA